MGLGLLAKLVLFSITKKVVAYAIARTYGFPRIYRRIREVQKRLFSRPTEQKLRDLTLKSFRLPKALYNKFLRRADSDLAAEVKNTRERVRARRARLVSASQRLRLRATPFFNAASNSLLTASLRMQQLREAAMRFRASRRLRDVVPTPFTQSRSVPETLSARPHQHISLSIPASTWRRPSVLNARLAMAQRLARGLPPVRAGALAHWQPYRSLFSMGAAAPLARTALRLL
eukprot:tig00000383_g24649.t1